MHSAHAFARALLVGGAVSKYWFDSMMVEDRESNEYIESVFRLLTAYPETLRNIGTQKQHSPSAARSIQRGNKRKFANSEE
eukprot:scaffold2911_cov73-Skeletonema_marinoi.AAC.4